jgi:hypothetical protein
MDEEKRKRVFRIYNWARIILFVLLLTFIFVKLVKAQTTNDFGVWVSAGSEKSVRDSWIFGISTELRTKDYSKRVARWHKSMDKEKAERIIKIVNWVRYIILAVFLTFVFVALSKA